jgi:hypothetical protein
MEGDFYFMRRQALSNSRNSQSPQVKNSPVSLLLGSARLSLFFIVALALAFFLASGNVTAERLFQSPQSPPQQPTLEQPPAEQPPAEQPPAEQPPAEQPPAEQPPAEQPATTEPATSPQPVGEAAPAPTLEPLAPVTTEEEDDYPPPATGDTPMVLDEAELIDSVFVSAAYLWLCCGVILLLLIPLAMLILYIRGRSKIVNEKGF